MQLTACRNFFERQRLSRRQLISAGPLSLLGLTLPDLLRGRQLAAAPTPLPALDGSFGRAKSCILLFMWGGPAHQDTFDMKPNAPLEVRGEFKPIPTRVPGIQICEHLPQLAQRTDQLAIIRSMTHPDVNHTTATSYLLTGHAPPVDGNLHGGWPHLGAVLSKLGRGTFPLPPFVNMRPKLPNDVPRFVEQSHGQFAGWLGQSFDPLTIDSDPGTNEYHVGDFALQPEIRVDRLDNRRLLLETLEAQRRGFAANLAIDDHYRRAFALLDSSVADGVFDLEGEPAELRDRYGRNSHGQSVLQARRLIEHGVPLVTVFWPNDGIKNVSVYWDTHSKNFIDLRERLMPVADQAFSALLDDLQDRGLLDETLVIWTGEFGRTPRVGQRNSDAGAGSDGRDHWPNCFTTVLAGGGIRGGQVYGSSDRDAAYPSSDAVEPVDLMATVCHALGVPPQLELHDQQNRPLVFCPGTPLLPLFG